MGSVDHRAGGSEIGAYFRCGQFVGRVMISAVRRNPGGLERRLAIGTWSMHASGYAELGPDDEVRW